MSQPQSRRQRSLLARAMFYLFKLAFFLGLVTLFLRLHGWWYQTAAQRVYPFVYDNVYGIPPEEGWFPSQERLSYNQALADFTNFAYVYGGRIFAAITACLGALFLWPGGNQAEGSESVAAYPVAAAPAAVLGNDSLRTATPLIFTTRKTAANLERQEGATTKIESAHIDEYADADKEPEQPEELGAKGSEWQEENENAGSHSHDGKAVWRRK